MKKLMLFLTLTFFFACSSSENKTFEQTQSTEIAKTNEQIQQPYGNTYSNLDEARKPEGEISMHIPDFNRKMVKNADYKFEVEDVDKSTMRIHQLAKEYSGFVSNMNLSTSTNSMTNRMTIKVINEQFESLLAALSKESIFVHHKRINTQDVTEQYVDFESRLNVKKQVKDRYATILKKEAKTMAQVLNVEEKIRVLQEEIETKEGQMRSLADKVTLSEIKLEMVQEVEYKDKLEVQNKSFAQKASDSFLNGWNSILNVGLGILNYWHVGLLLGMFWFGRNAVLDLISRIR